MARRRLTRDDVMSMDDYAESRRARRRSITELKRHRRIGVGPHATLYFENYETMWMQVHEMLFIERGGDAQIDDELAAYGPLVPNGRELVATLMFEIADESRRRAFLATIGGIERHVGLAVGNDVIAAVAETEIDRTTADGKASAVHFLHFPFSAAQVASFRDPSSRVAVGIEHANYGHVAVLPSEMRAALSGDFD